jgi:hypothetical protein
MALTLIVAGCGGGGDSTTSAKVIPKAVFIKKADAICEKGNERMAGAFVTFLKKHKNVKRPSEANYEELVGTILVPSVKQEVKAIRALGVPSGDEDRVSEFIEALEEGIDTAESDPKAVAGSSDVVFGIASRLAKEYGLQVCGSR